MSGILISREISRDASPRPILTTRAISAPMTSRASMSRRPMNGERTFSLALHTADCICCAAAAAADDGRIVLLANTTGTICVPSRSGRRACVRACGTYKDGQVSAVVRLPVNGIAEVITDFSRRSKYVNAKSSDFRFFVSLTGDSENVTENIAKVHYRNVL